MEDMTKYIGQDVEVWNEGYKLERVLVAILPPMYKYRYIVENAIDKKFIESYMNCNPLPKRLEWYENPENYGKAVKVRFNATDKYFIRQLNQNTTKDWNYYERLNESDWKMI